MQPQNTNASGHGTITRNTLAALAQAIVTAAVLFVVYGFVVNEVGLVDFGVWAVVAAAAAAASIGNLGLGAGAVKYVAKYIALGDQARARAVALTTVSTVAAFVGVLAALAYLVVPWILPAIILVPKDLELALELLPWSLFAFWAGSVGATLNSALDGRNRVDLRAGSVLVGIVVYVGVLIPLVPRLGVQGLVYAQIGQGVATSLAAWVFHRRVDPASPRLPFGFQGDVLREVWGYGASFQAISIAQILFEPTAKAVLSRVGGPAATGLFEMANRFLTQFRSLVNSSHQAVLPVIAQAHENDPARVDVIYVKSVRLISMIALSMVPAATLAAPVLAIIWLGHVDTQFVSFVVILAWAWLLNLLANPAYYSNAGIGQLRWNLIGHGIMAVVNPILGMGLGYLMGSVGVVLGYAIALLAGSLAIAIEYGRRTGTKLHQLVGRADGLLVFSGVAASVIACYLSPWIAEAYGSVVLTATLVLAFAGVVGPVLLYHPQARWMVTKIRNSVHGKASNP